MTEIVINITEVRKDVDFVETLLDLEVVQHEVHYLAEEAEVRLEFAILEAQETLLAIGSLKRRSATYKSSF